MISKRTSTLLLAFVSVCCLLVGCAEVKQAGRTIGHTSRDVTRDIGHASRDIAKDLTSGGKRVVAEASAEEDDNGEDEQ